ncbi:MAG TPA: CsbD family protein [Chloroflexota bacterium]|nr:CsbD family protein [Chloroflexota bacterium]
MDEETIKGKTQQGTGFVKEKMGQVTGDPNLEAQGKNDQAAGKVREGFGNARGKVRDGVDALADKASEAGARVRDAADRTGRAGDQSTDSTI